MTGYGLRGARACLVGILSTGIASAAAVAAEPSPPAAHAADAVDFDRQIRPILSDKCFQCHGPDANERQAELRLDLKDEAFNPAESGEPAIVPGKAEKSNLVKRVFSKNQSFMMPPPKSNKSLTEAQKQLLKTWVAQGARYETHWSFSKPVRSAVPAVKDRAWVRNSIDRFILARLEAQGMRPSPEATRTALIRRVTLDLTGLPPTPAEIDAFLADRKPDAYERVVDRLLGSSHYGERVALDWLDAARFADTHGYHIDSGRDMTPWRDWVIEAFNSNMPFDRFTVEQLAGDLLPNASTRQRVASGFNRNHMINFEGGAIPEEYQTAYVIDRVNTTSTVWLGLTVACAQCHDHKFDPISQKDYYQLYAFFNNIQENGLDGRSGNAVPILPIPTPVQARERDRLTSEIARIEQQLNGPRPEVDALQAAWESTLADNRDSEWVVLNPSKMSAVEGTKLAKLDDRSIVARGANPDTDVYTIVATTDLKTVTALRLETLPDTRLNGSGPGRGANGNIVLTELSLRSAGRPLKIKAAGADFSQDQFPVAQAIDGQRNTGWAVFPEVGKPHSAVFVLDEPITAEKGVPLTTVLEFQSQYSRHVLGKFRLSVSSSSRPAATVEMPAKIVAILALDRQKRTEAQKQELRTYYRTQVSAECKPLTHRLAELRQAESQLTKTIPTTMVMQERPDPRSTFMLERGQYDKRGERVDAGVPASLGRLPEGAPANRLGLAQWLVDPAHPLTARVTVNRLWQMVFGTGLVKTAEDFGSQGELPSHPDLLNWLAVEFREGWDVKAMVRLMVTSATYRQSSHVTAEQAARDPENRLLARGPRLRLQAEFIRDQALAVSGLLDARVGGKSVSPYQPAGIWEELASRLDGKNFTAQSYEQDHGRDLYRRTMYTFWKRTSPPPTLVTFDAPDRETCTVRRARTNTPLQALVLLNDPTYVEAARKLAERMMTEGGSTAEERIAFAFRLATARMPRAEEVAVLKSLFDSERTYYRNDIAAADKLTRVGEAPRNTALDVPELAAWSMVASAILNLDETVTKG